MDIFRKIPLYSKSDLRYLCEKLIPFTKISGLMLGSNFCCFHDNRNTPAASVFKDADDIERMYCYACKRQYTSYDYITLVLEENPLKHLLKIASKETMDEMLKYKVNRIELETAKLKFESIDKLLDDVYNYDDAISLN